MSAVGAKLPSMRRLRGHQRFKRGLLLRKPRLGACQLGRNLAALVLMHGVAQLGPNSEGCRSMRLPRMSEVKHPCPSNTKGRDQSLVPGSTPRCREFHTHMPEPHF